MIKDHIQPKESRDTLTMLKNTRTEFAQESQGEANLRLNTIIGEIEHDIDSFETACAAWLRGSS